MCGAGSTGRNVIEELIATGVPVIAIDTREAELKEIADKYPEGGVHVHRRRRDRRRHHEPDQPRRARAASSRRCRPTRTTSTSRCRRARPTRRRGSSRAAPSCRTSRRSSASGADAVVSPNFIGGMRLVSELMRPAVVAFLDDMLRDAARRIASRRSASATEPPSSATTLRDARVRERFGMTVLAMRAGDSERVDLQPRRRARSSDRG